MTTIGRGSVVVAMSSGLVATVGLPAQAAPEPAAGPEPAAPAAAPAAAPVGAAFTTALVSNPSTAAASAPLTAPATARVTFETGAFKALPKPKVKKAAPVASRAAVETSTSAKSSSSEKSSSRSASKSTGSAKGSSVLAIAARYEGVPYRYGGNTPASWDCSGATKYIYAQAGIELPRTANEQMQAATRVSRSEARPGDLVFFVNGGRATHVGIYAGNNMMWDAGSSGKTFSKREIYTSDVVFGRP